MHNTCSTVFFGISTCARKPTESSIIEVREMCTIGLLMELLLVEETSLDSTVNKLCSTVSRTPPTNMSCWGGFSSNTFWAAMEELDGLLEIAKELDDGICGVAVDLQ